MFFAKKTYKLIVDYGNDVVEYPFTSHLSAAQAWRMCDYEITTYKDAAHMKSASVVDDKGNRLLHVKYIEE